MYTVREPKEKILLEFPAITKEADVKREKRIFSRVYQEKGAMKYEYY